MGKSLYFVAYIIYSYADLFACRFSIIQSLSAFLVSLSASSKLTELPKISASNKC